MGNVFSKVLKRRRPSKKLCACMADFGVRYSNQLENDVKNLSDQDLMEKYGKLNVTVVAEITGKSYKETLKIMEKVRQKYNVDFAAYADEKLYLYEGDALVKKIGDLRVRDERYLNMIVADTGWTRLQAIRKVTKFNQKYKASYKKYSGYRFDSKTDEEIKALYDRWNATAKKNREKVQKESGWPMYKVRVHMRRVAVQFDIIPAYYILYKAWELTDEQLAGYATQELSRQLMVKHTKLKDRKLLSDKFKFDEIFKDYINRKHWINVDTSYEEFLEFIDGVDEIFCKPIQSGGGLGTSKVKVDRENPKAQYEYLMGRGRYLHEECVKQHPLVNEFVATSVNTIRVVTVADNGEYKIICTGMRFGHEGITDNFSSTGMVADVDPETGIIITDAIDKKGNIYEKHPVSGKVFKGFQIPLWDQVIQVAKNAMDVIESINYVGWDIAISEKGPVIIEANPMPDLVLIQAPYAKDKIGKRYLFEKYL